jgi:hypothetical protein
VAVIILGIIDWLTGYELNFFVFYFLPVSLPAWYLGLEVSVSLAVLSALVWFMADYFSGHDHFSNVYAVWNTLIRLIAFLAIGWTFSRLRASQIREHETSEALRKSLSEIKVLETFLPICAQCKKIRNQEGDWQPVEIYIGQNSDTRFSHSYCPECAREIMRQAGLTGGFSQIESEVKK